MKDDKSNFNFINKYGWIWVLIVLIIGIISVHKENIKEKPIQMTREEYKAKYGVDAPVPLKQITQDNQN